MKIVNILLAFWVLCFFSGTAASDAHKQYGKGHQGKGQSAEQLDSRIEQWVKKTCAGDTVCAEKKRAEYIERMAKYKQHVQEKCGADEACRQNMRAKYMQRRAKREQRIAQHCGDDEACRDELREKYSSKMKHAREKCGDDKACWNEFYKENKPKKN